MQLKSETVTRRTLLRYTVNVHASQRIPCWKSWISGRHFMPRLSARQFSELINAAAASRLQQFLLPARSSRIAVARGIGLDLALHRCQFLLDLPALQRLQAAFGFFPGQPSLVPRKGSRKHAPVAFLQTPPPISVASHRLIRQVPRRSAPRRFFRSPGLRTAALAAAAAPIPAENRPPPTSMRISRRSAGFGRSAHQFRRDVFTSLRRSAAGFAQGRAQAPAPPCAVAGRSAWPIPNAAAGWEFSAHRAADNSAREISLLPWSDPSAAPARSGSPHTEALLSAAFVYASAPFSRMNRSGSASDLRASPCQVIAGSASTRTSKSCSSRSEMRALRGGLPRRVGIVIHDHPLA